MITSGAVVQALITMPAGRVRVIVPVVVFGGLSVAAALLAWLRTLTTARLSRAHTQTVELSLVTAALKPTRIDDLEDQSFRSRLDAGLTAVREGVHPRVVPALADLWATRLGGTAGAVVLTGFHWWAPVVMLVGYLAFIRGYRQWLSTLVDAPDEEVRESRRRAEYYRSLMSEPAAAKEVRLFGLAPWLDDRFGRTWTSAMRDIWAHRASSARPVVLGTLTLLLGLLLVLGTLGRATVSGGLAAGAVLVYVQAVAAMDALAYQGDSAWHLARGREELAQLEALVGDAAERQPARSSPVRAPSGPGPSVSITDLTFRYPGQAAPVLRGLDLEIPPGQSLAVVGSNGAGKSTLIKLLCGLYAPTSGRILVDGEIARPDRRQTAAIFQNFGRYIATLGDNVGFGDVESLRDDEAVTDAIRAAGGEEILRRATLSTMLAPDFPGGTDFSGGQWQRIALARALLAARAGAKVLVLDEPTAALDIRAEVEVFTRFLGSTRGMTTVLVSHRLSSVRHADRIVVLDEGRIAEDGTHHELLAAGGRYATMFALQQARFVDRPPDRGTHDHA